MGTDFEEIGKSLALSTVRLTSDHRFKKWTSGPLGEINHSAFRSYGEKLGEFDGAVYRIVYSMIDKLLLRTDLLKRYSADRIGLFFGTSTSCLDQSQRSFFNYIKSGDQNAANLIRTHHLNGATVKMIKKFFGIRGIDQTFSTACSSSAHSIAEGFSALKMGLIDAAIVGGFDILNEVTICGFSSLQILDNQVCKPFSRKRQGTNLSEGGAFLVLERESANPLALLVGAGASSDAYQMTQPDPTAAGMKLSMARALQDAQLLPSQISYINAHGTATEPNDRSEAFAINQVFGSGEDAPLVSSTKGYHGHALGGAGALEAAVSIAALRANQAWRGSVEESELEYSHLVRYQNSTEKTKSLDYILSNSFGFGGNNVSLIFKKYQKNMAAS